MKYNGKSERLVGLLARGYVGFTVAMILITGISIWLSNLYFDRLARMPDIDGLAQSRELQEGRYEEVPLRKYLDQESVFAVADETGQFLYCSSDEAQELLGDRLTEGELLCVQPYMEDSYIESVPFHGEDGSQAYMLVKRYFGEEEIEDRVVILDADFRVRSGSLGDGKKKYTSKEFSILAGNWPEGYEILKYPLGPAAVVTADGEADDAESMPEAQEESGDRVLLVASKSLTMEGYDRMTRKSDRMFFLSIPLYLIAVTAFVLWLNRKIKKPLVGLNQAIDSLTGGGNGRAGDLDGPWEIRQIGNNFDRMADLLAESERQRQKMDDERQRLLADISHDLKTPITVISGYTKAMKDGKIPAEKTDAYLELIDTKVDELTGMINSFHEFSKVEHPKFVLQTVVTDVCEFMRGYLADRYDEIEIAGFTLRAMIPEDVRYLCALDVYQFRRALDNILYNTLKYNTLGTELAVGVAMVNRGIGDKKSICILIADNGIGIPQSRRENIFEPFVQGDVSRGSGGSGLGLAITRRIVLAHGGRVELNPVCLEGFTTQFEILLPLAEEGEPAPGP